MKILMIGADKEFNAEYFYRQAFRKSGNSILFVNEYEGVNHEFILRILSTRFSIARVILSNLPINKKLIKVARGFNPDAIIFFKGELISTDNIIQLSKEFQIYLFYPDMMKFKPILKKRLEHFNIIFTAANIHKPYYDLGAKKVVTIPWACDPSFHRKLQLEAIYPVSFVGTRYRERARILRKIPSVEIFGDFWRNSDGNVHGKVIGDDYINVLNRTKINLNLQAKENLEVDAPTMRTFEIAGSGNFQLTNNMPSVKKYFPAMPTFRTASELIELINHFMENREEREEIALDCMKLCRERFTYDIEAAHILENL